MTHVIARGHTLEAIAHRYHVSVQSIVTANHIKDPKHLKVGDTLTIPGATATGTAKTASANGKTGGKISTNPTKAFAARAKTPGVIHATRLLTNENFTIRVSDRRGRQSPTAAKTFEKMLRSASGLPHPIDPRLIALAAIVSNHFGSRKLDYISGFRPYTPTQYTPHSNHNLGRAMDFRVDGVPNEVLRDYCRTLKNVGVGYYPNSTFVHLDVRTSPAYWIDYSKPGEAPRYNNANVDADEGTSDVADESHPPATTDGTPTAPQVLDPSMVPPPATSGSAAPPIAPTPPAQMPTQIPSAATPIAPAPTSVAPVTTAAP
ncbi:MAG: DUF882 domain-containing protein [Polyangiaceae bacterium]